MDQFLLSMSQLPSYSALSLPHQMFVHAYIKHGDGAKAIAALHPELSHEQCVRKAWKLSQRDDIKHAIQDKLREREERYDTSRLAIVERLFRLLEKIEHLPSQQMARAIKLELEVLKEVSAISGHHLMKHEHTDNRNITVQLIGIDEPPVDVVAEIPAPELVPLEPQEPVRYDLSDLDDISDEVDPEAGSNADPH